MYEDNLNMNQENGNQNTNASQQGTTYGNFRDTYEGQMPHADMTKKGNSFINKLKSSSFTKKVCYIVVFALIFGVVSGSVFSVTNHYIKTAFGDGNYTIGTAAPVVSGGESENTDITQVAANCMPCVVSITNRGVTEVRTFFGTFQQESMSSGSGVIIGRDDDELLIVTNFHVVASSQELTVVFSFDEHQNDVNDKSAVAATVKGYDSQKDIAVIAVKLEDLTQDTLNKVKIATIGESSALALGQQVIAIGNALGYGQSVTVGYLSALSRELTLQGSDGSVIQGTYLQTDAAINPGNSGGALLNAKGELIGINSAKAGQSMGGTSVEGMGYAIPIDIAEPIIESIMEKSDRSVVAENERGYLGITGQTVTSEARDNYGMPVGVYVAEVTENCGAEKAGISVGNIITKIEGTNIGDMESLQSQLSYYKAGEKINVSYAYPTMEGYSESTVIVTLSSAAQIGKTK